MEWKKHIGEWAKSNNRDAFRQEEILTAEGWDPQKYQSSMKKALFNYLDKWHALHIKNMPKPATSSFRRNPDLSYKCLHNDIYDNYRIFTCMGCGETLKNIDWDQYEQY